MQKDEIQQTGTTNDESKDMQFEGDEYKNMEGETRSTAAEGTLKTTDENTQQQEVFKGNEEDSKDNDVEKTETDTTTDDPTYRPSLEEDESMDKEQG